MVGSYTDSLLNSFGQPKMNWRPTFIKQTAPLCDKFESILLLKRALWMAGLGFRDLQWFLGHFSWLSNCQSSVSPDLNPRDERFQETPITTSFFVAIVVNGVQLLKKLAASVGTWNVKICYQTSRIATKRGLQSRSSENSSSERSWGLNLPRSSITVSLDSSNWGQDK